MTRTESSILFVDNPNEIISDGGMTSMNSGKPIMFEQVGQFPRAGESTTTHYLSVIGVIIIASLLVLRFVKKNEIEEWVLLQSLKKHQKQL